MTPRLINKTIHLASSGIALCMVNTISEAALNFEISGYQTQIADSTTTIPSETGLSNFTGSTHTGDFAVFDIQATDDQGITTSDYAQLKVTYEADNGGVGSNIMIAQTSDSQGLKDSGTLSVLANIGSSDGGTVSLKFEWYTWGSFSNGEVQESANILSQQINYTTLDIDVYQTVSIAKSDITSYTLDATTLLTATDDGSSIAFTDAGADTTGVSDPRTAVSFTASTTGTQLIEMGKQSASGYTLFIFEFRDPGILATFSSPETTPVPEGASASLWLGASLFAFAMLRRTPRN
jgi:hypothetical protein